MSVIDRMIGDSNEGNITIQGVKSSGLIDSGSMISSISESFYNSLEPKPVLGDVSDFGHRLLVVIAALHKM